VNITFDKKLSICLSLATFVVMGRCVAAQAQAITTEGTEASTKLVVVHPTKTSSTASTGVSSLPRQVVPGYTSVPIPGTTITSADNLKPHLAQSVPLYPNSAPSVPTAPAIPATPTPNTAPATPSTPTTAPNFSDVGADYWAYPFIQTLAASNVIVGFPDGTFRPDKPVSRAEFAAMLQKAFHPQPVRQLSPSGFSDVPANYWGEAAIRSAYEGGYLAGYPNNLFLPNQKIIKVQAIAGLASGLNLSHTGVATDVLNTYYTDAGQVPLYAVDSVAAATQAHLVVNYPDVKTLNPRTPLTRAEAAAILDQALVHLGKLPPLASNVAAASYIVGGPTSVSQAPTTPAPAPSPAPAPAAATVVNDYSYIGGAINFGLVGDKPLGNTNFTVISKLRLLKNLPISFRPAAVIGGHTDFLLPVTYDFNSTPSVKAFGHNFAFSPYAGLGLLIPSNDGGNLGPVLTGGVDYRINRDFTATLGLNLGWEGGDTQFGLLLGIGYNFGFRGF